MNTKQKSLAITVALAFISAILSYVSWSYGARQEGFLGTVFGVLVFLFAVMAIIAVVAVVIIGRTSDAHMENRKKKKRGKGKSSATSQAGTALEIPGADFVPPADPAPAPRSAAPGPRPVKKTPRPVSKGPRPVKKD
ncbi:MAG: hypothetical protein KDA42_18725 [Planctomycetales bacterium]|nr:hypothetical protein [Planctomycetales bacterium]